MTFNALSLLTTSGYYMANGDGPHVAPAIVLLFPLIIGGAVISTTGGLKIARLGLLIQHSLREMKRLSFPHGQFKFRYNERVVTEGMIAGVWALFLGFMAIVAITALLIGTAGFDFTASLAGSMAAVMNTGPALSYFTAGEVGFHDFPIYVNALLILAMIIGRVEVLAFLVLLNRNFWRS
jgi:trk system potassium uptake protein TrkH